MKINTKDELVDFGGTPLKGPDGTLTLGYALSNILSLTKEGGKMKTFILAKKFYTDDLIDLDEADLALVKSAIEKSDIYSNLVMGQLLIKLNEK